MAMSIMEGNEAIARGAIAAGCNFFAGYPITPATTIFNNMLKLLPPKGGICIQGEDEIASIGYCIGAAMAGMKAFTATSGPGISLFSEQISFAIGAEIPLVIADVQRLGPSTGSATRGADSDIQFLRWGNSGGVPIIVLAPVDAADCYELTVHAFNFSEQFRCPVFIASNKEIGLTKESLDVSSLRLPKISNRAHYEGDNFQPFEASAEQSPSFLPIGGSTIVRTTSSTHGADGYITNDPETIGRSQARIRDKILSHQHSITLWDQTIEDGSEILIITYGVTSRAVAESIKLAKKQGLKLSHLTLKTIWPVPEALILTTAEPFSRILVFEMNLGQYVEEVRKVLPAKCVEFYGQLDGTLITPEQILKAVEHGSLS